MDPERAQAVAERDQLWASLRALRTDIDLLAQHKFDGSERQARIIQVLARIVAAEMDFRKQEGDG